MTTHCFIVLSKIKYHIYSCFPTLFFVRPCFAHAARALGKASQTHASVSQFRLLAVSTFPPVSVHRVHRVYSDTADSSVTPSNSHAPRFLQSAHSHVLITHCLRYHWTESATPLFLIGNMLPPASLLWILFLVFFSFFLVASFDSLSWG